MLMRRSALRLLASAAVGVGLLGVASCGGLSAGDHVFYRIAFDTIQRDASCYPDKEIPDSAKEDTSTLRNGATFILYSLGDEHLQLDTGTFVLPGVATEDGYSFTGDAADVTYPPGETYLDADQDGVKDSVDPEIDADKDGVDDSVDPEVDTDADSRDDRSGDPLVDADKDGKDDRLVEDSSGIKFTATTKINVEMKVEGLTISGKLTTVTGQRCDDKDGESCPTEYEKSCTQTGTFEGFKIEQADVNVGVDLSPPGDDL